MAGPDKRLGRTWTPICLPFFLALSISSPPIFVWIRPAHAPVLLPPQGTAGRQVALSVGDFRHRSRGLGFCTEFSSLTSKSVPHTGGVPKILYAAAAFSFRIRFRPSTRAKLTGFFFETSERSLCRLSEAEPRAGRPRTGVNLGRAGSLNFLCARLAPQDAYARASPGSSPQASLGTGSHIPLSCISGCATRA